MALVPALEPLAEWAKIPAASAAAWTICLSAVACTICRGARALVGGPRHGPEEGLAEWVEQFKILFDHSPDPKAIVDREDHRILKVNHACEVLLHRPADTLVGKTVFVFCSTGGVKELRDLLALARTQGAASQPTTLARPDGSGIGVTASAFPWGRSPAVLLSFSSASDLVKAEREGTQLEGTLRSVAAEWTRTFDTIPVGILLLGPDGGVKRLNEAARALAGGGFREILGAPLARLGAKEPWRTAAIAARAVSADGAVFFRQVEDAASGRTWNVTVSSMEGVEGREAGVIVTVQEATQVVALQDALRRSERMAEIGTLVSGVAHEVRNPLFTISVSIDTLEAELGAATVPRDTVELLRDAVNRLVSLMQDLLDYGRPSARERAPEAVESVAHEAVRQCQPLARTGGVDLVTRCAGDVPPVDMDRNRLVRALQNVIQNAIQHSPPDGVVDVQVDRIRADGQEWVACAVRDRGPGFSEEDLRRAFEPLFYRRPGGTGLGLSIARKVAEEHGGRVQVENHPDGGAWVSLRLPPVDLRGRSR